MAKGLAAVVDQGEFQLGRGHHAASRARRNGPAPRERMARVAVERRAVFVVHGHRHQRLGRIEPWQGHRPAPGGSKHAIRIARVKHQRAAFDIGPEDIHVQHRKRHADRACIELQGIGAGDALAAHLAIEVAGGDPDRGMIGKLHRGTLLKTALPEANPSLRRTPQEFDQNIARSAGPRPSSVPKISRGESRTCPGRGAAPPPLWRPQPATDAS